jgi:hypothetical protein
MGISLVSRTVLYAALLGVVSFAGVTSASEPVTAQANDRQQVFVDKRAPASARDASAAQLRSKAARRGRVRVIVGLAVATSDEELSEVEEGRQTQRLHAVQDSLANRVGVAAADVAKFDHVPFVSMWVDAVHHARRRSIPTKFAVLSAYMHCGASSRSRP